MIAKIEDFEKYIPDLRKLFYYKLKKYHLKDVKSAVDDLMQDFFIELWKQSERCFANEEHYKHFLFLNYKWFCLRIKRNLYFLNKASMPEEVFEIPNKAYEYNINDEIELFKSILTPDECLVLDKRLEGYNQREIALNHNINEITAKPLNYDEIDPAYNFHSDGPQQSMTQMGMGKRPYDFVSKGPSDVFEDDEMDFDLGMEDDEMENEPNFNDLLDDEDYTEDEMEQIEESVKKTLDVFKRFKKFN